MPERLPFFRVEEREKHVNGEGEKAGDRERRKREKDTAGCGPGRAETAIYILIFDYFVRERRLQIDSGAGMSHRERGERHGGRRPHTAQEHRNVFLPPIHEFHQIEAFFWFLFHFLLVQLHLIRAGRYVD